MKKLEDGVLLIVLVIYFVIGFVPAWCYWCVKGKWPAWYNLIHFQ